MINPKKTIEVIAAVRNEAETLNAFVDEMLKIKLEEVMIRLTFVEDGSSDNTLAQLERLAKTHYEVNYYSISNNLGQGMALSYGIIHSYADAIITMDADGSFPAAVVRKMIEKHIEGFDIVQGNRLAYERKELYRKIGSKLYFALFTLLTGVNLHSQNVHFRLMNKSAVQRYREAPACWFSVRLNNSVIKDLKRVSIPFEAVERLGGKSKFNFKRLLSYAYRSFLTLTSVTMFIGLTIFLFAIVAIIWNYFSNIMAGVFLIPVALNIIFYTHEKSINYLKRVKLLHQG